MWYYPVDTASDGPMLILMALTALGFVQHLVSGWRVLGAALLIVGVVLVRRG